MIRISRGAEPAALKKLRISELNKLRLLGAAVTSEDIVGYRVVAQRLWKAQHYKCCYCEDKITSKFNDVEHYRPKGTASREPGCAKIHGYWWLAFTWKNLLFACPSCNRSGKNDKFPLALGSISLQPERRVPGKEIPLLIDPASAINPVEHITFERQLVGNVGAKWWARPRNMSQLGLFTIDVCRLNSDDLFEMRNDFFENTIEPQISALTHAISNGLPDDVRREFGRAMGMLRPANPFVAFTYDAFRLFVSSDNIEAAIGQRWPAPNEVGVP